MVKIGGLRRPQRGCRSYSPTAVSPHWTACHRLANITVSRVRSWCTVKMEKTVVVLTNILMSGSVSVASGK
jgi:hypothetical protein